MAIKLVTEKLGAVASAMSEVVCVIDHDATVAEAVKTLADLMVTGAPVVHGERVVGVVSQQDLLRARESSERVAELMTETVYAVRPDHPLLLAIRLMVTQRIHRVIVVNEAGQLYGVLSAMDVLRVLIRDVAEEGSLDYVDLRKLAISKAMMKQASEA